MKDTDAAWAAGFMDGEGHIGLALNSKNGATNPIMSADQVKREPLDELQLLYGGKVSGPRTSNGGSEFYEWRTTDPTEITPALESMLPYFRVKRPHAVLMLSYLKMVEEEVRITKRAELTEDDLRRRISFYANMKELNRRGQK